MDSIHFLNGKFVTEKDLLISPRDLGYSRGYGVFDFIITYKNRPFLLDRHISRLFLSAETIGLTLPWSKKDVTAWVIKTLEANASVPGQKVIRISISGGVSFSLSQAETPTIVITVDPDKPCLETDYKNGVAAGLVEFQRYLPSAKSNNYIEAVRSFQKQDPISVDELIYYSDNMIREGTRSNVFAVINNKLLTPKTGILAGVTRDLLLEILDLQIPVLAEDFSVDDLSNASELFIAATGKRVMPVVQLNSKPVGNGDVGSITREVMKQHSNFIDSDQW